MVKVSLDESGYTGHIILEPNISLSWKANLHIFIFISVITLGIAAYFMSIGGWLVLPFSGLELALIGTSLYMFFHHYNHCEVIRFTDQKVVIEHGKNEPEESWEYQRHWSKIHIERKGSMDIPVVRIKSHGKETELGAFLGYDEKTRFIKILEEVTNKFSQSLNRNIQAKNTNDKPA